MRWIPVLLFVIVAPRSADAGLMCIGDDQLDGYVAQLEAVAKSPAKASDLAPHWRYCLDGDAKRKPRIVKACTAIAARLDTSKPPNDDAQYAQHQCVPALAGYGVNPIKTKTKDLDHVGDLLAKNYPVHDDPSDPFRTMEHSNDPRVLPKIVELYRAAIETTTKTPPAGWRAENWLRWRRAALSVIQVRGTHAELAFLDEVAAATKDKRVLSWIKVARTAITKRDP